MANNPSRPFYIFAAFDTPSGNKTISQLEFGRAAHRVAHLLRPNRDGVDGEVVAIVSHTDTVLYHAIVAGLIVAGCVVGPLVLLYVHYNSSSMSAVQPFPISPRNSPGAIVELLTKTSCCRLLTTHAYLDTLIAAVKSHTIGNSISDLLIEEVPSIASVYPYLAHETTDDPFERYPPATKRPSPDDLCLYLHSSGSTGNPRPIPQTHIYWLQAASPPDFRENLDITYGFMCMPAFHAFGIGVQLFQPLYNVFSVGVYPPNAALPDPLPPIVPSPENVLEHTKRTNSQVLTVPPTFLQIWALLPNVVEYLKSLRYIGFGGGPLAPKMGKLLVEAGVRLHAMYGGTEFGMSTRFTPVTAKDDWEYMQFQDYLNIRWAPQGDGTFECQFLASEKHQTMIKNLPDAEGYATSDLWKPHSTKKHLWKIVGRIDDVIIHSSGEKTVPGPMEAIVVSDPLVRDAVIFGRERDQAGILIELQAGTEIDVEDHAQLASLRNKLWPTIEEANDVAPAHSRIFKEMILIASKEKPLPRAGKGTILRKAAVKVYEEDINAIYDNVEAIVANSSSPTSWSVADVEAWIIEQANDIISGSTVVPTTDLFQQGFDSLHATSLRLRIVNALRLSEDLELRRTAKGISSSLVYSFPVIKDLAYFISSLLTSPKATQATNASQGAAALKAMIAKYTAGFETSLPETSSIQPSAPLPTVVLLTGSTGNLGSQILAVLLGDPRVDKVYAYNRPSTVGGRTLLDRHSDKFKEVGLDVSLLGSEKLVLLAGDATETNLGLDRGRYNLLCRTVDVVIHNAWRLDFNLTLASYEPNIQGTRNLIELVRSGPNSVNVRFLFVSSIAAVQHWDRSKGAVPEDAMVDVSVALGGGYGEAKHVAERILLQSGLQGLTLRLGQISGGRPKGAWPTTEWLPILVKTSLTLGALPDACGTASWLGADTISATIVDLALSPHKMALPKALNLVHPRPVEQRAVFQSIKMAIGEVLGRHLNLVPFGEWFTMVEKSARNVNVETWDTIPAIKLLEFFREYAVADTTAFIQSEAGGLPSLSTEKAQSTSDFMGPSLPQLGFDDAKLWVSYWHGVGFITG
ncbi:putative NRPS-like protein biosynthetic cluster [Tephrocybe rancida]|nr:putative NRPS-like protein biosynthetic cluster [Tephrocybe rancida]